MRRRNPHNRLSPENVLPREVSEKPYHGFPTLPAFTTLHHRQAGHRARLVSIVHLLSAALDAVSWLPEDLCLARIQEP